MDTKIVVGTWVVVRDESSEFDGYHGRVDSIIADASPPVAQLVNDDKDSHPIVPLSSLHIPADGTDPDVKEELQKLAESSDDLARQFKIAEFRINASKTLGMIDQIESLGIVTAPSPIRELLTLAQMVTRDAAMLLGVEIPK